MAFKEISQDILSKYTGVFRTTQSCKATAIRVEGNDLYIKRIMETAKKSKDKVASGRIAKKATTKSASKKATKATTVCSVAGPASLLHLASNGVPAIRISGATPEESALNADLQPVAILHPEGTLITFDITNGEITGVRSGGELYAREAGIESLAGTETWADEHEKRTCVEGLLGFGKY